MEFKCKNCGWYNPDNKTGEFLCPCKQKNVWGENPSCKYIELVNGVK